MSIRDQWSGKSARQANTGRFTPPRTGADHLGPPVIPAPGEIGPGYAGRGRWAGDPGTVAGAVPAGSPRPDLQHLGSATPPGDRGVQTSPSGFGVGGPPVPGESGNRLGGHGGFPFPGRPTGREIATDGNPTAVPRLQTGGGFGDRSDALSGHVSTPTGPDLAQGFNRPYLAADGRPPARGPEHDGHTEPDVYSGWLARAVAHHRGRR